MMECEICREYFHADNIEACPRCGLELCPECYERHVSLCMAEEWFDKKEREESTIPHICPKCGEELELALEMDGSASVYCPNSACDFEEELDDEQLAELNGDEDDDDEEEDEEERE